MILLASADSAALNVNVVHGKHESRGHQLVLPGDSLAERQSALGLLGSRGAALADWPARAADPAGTGHAQRPAAAITYVWTVLCITAPRSSSSSSSSNSIAELQGNCCHLDDDEDDNDYENDATHIAVHILASSSQPSTKSPAGALPVTLPEGLTRERLLAFPHFNSWLETLARSLRTQHADPSHPFHADPYALRAVRIQSYDVFGGDRLAFLKLRAEVSNSAGETLPGSVFLRGPSVAMLVMLLPEDEPDHGKDVEEEERYVLLTVQPRVPAGSLAFAELPAGMVDEAGAFAGTAAREIREELGLEIPASRLRCLSDEAAAVDREEEREVEEEKGEYGEREERLPEAMYPSAGGCDEHIPIYMHERRVPRSQLAEWTGRLTGLREHGERITLRLVPMRRLWREGRRDAKCLAALALWEGLRREGRL
ncbi:hypothetical protein GGR56DRAFT_674478 [Xylariaceae sp. FL0804]|nr:hypothetical protein GGR56DRAFT_674478 [Xylariaceae sp. FL0804]